MGSKQTNAQAYDLSQAPDPSTFSAAVRMGFGDSLDEDARKRKEQEDKEQADAAAAQQQQQAQAAASPSGADADPSQPPSPSAWQTLTSMGNDLYTGGKDMMQDAAEKLGLKKSDGRWNRN